jgi:hypothetical protein
MFRVLRSSEMVAPDRVRFSLRARALNPRSAGEDLELVSEIDTAELRDKLANRHVILTPEATYEALWQQLRVALDARDPR